MKLISEKNTPRWIIFFIDIFICFCSLMLSYQLRFNFHVPQLEISRWLYAIPAVLAARIFGFLLLKTYAGIIRYTGTKDAVRIFYAISGSTLSLALGNFIAYKIKLIYLVPFSILIIDSITSIFSLIAFRIFVKTVYQELKNPSGAKRDV